MELLHNPYFRSAPHAYTMAWARSATCSLPKMVET